MITAGSIYPNLVLSNWSHHTELQSWEHWVSWARARIIQLLVSRLRAWGVSVSYSRCLVIKAVIRGCVVLGVGANVILHYPSSLRWLTHTLPSRPACRGFQQGCEGDLRGGMLLSSQKKRGKWQSHSQGGSVSLSNANLLHKHDLPVLSV